MKEQLLEFLDNNYQKTDSAVALIGCAVVHFQKLGVRIIEHVDVENTVKVWQGDQ